MRKTIIASNGYGLVAEGIKPAGGPWLDLQTLAQVDMTSEDPEYPAEQAFATSAPGAVLAEGAPGGWKAGATGPQVLRLRFDAPQTVCRVLLRFREQQHERMQEFSLSATLRNGHTQEVVRQQWSFSPGGSTEEEENYTVDLSAVSILTLWIDPDRGRNRYPATLETFWVQG